MIEAAFDWTAIMAQRVGPDSDAKWEPIATYDKAAAEDVMLRDETQEMFGTWSTGYVEDGEVGEHAWRAIIEGDDSTPLWFEPTHFSRLSEEDRQILIEG